MDFMSDSLQGGRRFRTLNIIDDFNRELLDIVVDISISGHKVTKALDTVLLWRGKPKEIRVDNGSEFISHVFMQWCEEKEIRIKYTQKGKPTQNGLIERFNRSYREDVLDNYVFTNLEEVRILTNEWIYHYNYERPHRSLGKISPVKYLENYYKNQEEEKVEKNRKNGVF